jgi:hypothetical protein
VWSNVSAGTYTLSAQATDSGGLVGTSSPVNINVSTNLTPIADAYVADGSLTNSNFGTNTVLQCRASSTNGGNRDIYFKFDLTSVTNISSAQLRFFGSLSAAGTNALTVYTVTNTSWGETTITWNNKPTRVTALITNNVGGTNGIWYSFDVTSYVASQKKGGQNTISVALHNPTNVTQTLNVNSKENSANKPALVIITTNGPPSVSITNPVNNAVFGAPANIAINASASDDGSVAQVQFFQGSTSLGTVTAPPYNLTWSNVAAGSYALTAQATDNYGLMATSTVININVDNPPVAAITNPANNSVFRTGANIGIGASASESGGTISQVQFFQGATSLGVVTSAPYTMTWSNVAAGAYALTARATDSHGLVVTSSVVNIIVDLPTVSLTSPTNSAVINGPTNIVVMATASDTNGGIAQVQFFQGAVNLGSVSSSPYTVTWSNAPLGNYILTAVATASNGIIATSSPVNITVSTNLTPLADAYVADGSLTNSNFGTNTVLQCRASSTNGGNRDIYFKFDLTSVTNISSAQLKFFGNLTAAGTNALTVYTVTNTSWGETTITWNNKPTRVTALITNNVGGTNGIWYLFDVTSYVASQKKGGQNTISVALHTPTNVTQTLNVNSKENSTNKPALVIITTNSPPSVSITNPVNNAVFGAPANIAINASASDDGSVAQVQFFQGSTSLGTLTTPPYNLTWSNVTAGSYALTAQATDNYGLMATSMVVNINVDNPPVVTITNPANNSVFRTGSNIGIGASASESGGTISQVQFFQGATSLAVVTSAPYTMTWSNVAAGAYALTARATDSHGLVVTSSVVNIIVDLPTVSLTSPTNSAVINGPTNIVVMATASDTNGGIAQVQFFEGALSIGMVTNSPYNLTWSNAPLGYYTLTAVATASNGLMLTSSPVSIGVISLPELSSILLWLSADSIVGVGNNGAVSNWVDISGLNHPAIQTTSANRPTYVTNVINGKPVVRFNGNNSFLTISNALQGATGAQMFVMLRATTNHPSSAKIPWRFGPNLRSAYPGTDGSISDNFCSLATWQATPPLSITNFHLYSVASTSNGWANWVNGLQMNDQTGYFYITNQPCLGSSSSSFSGDMAEVLVYNRLLSSTEQSAVLSYFESKYAFLPLPPSPSGVFAVPVSASQIKVTWPNVVSPVACN